MLRCVVLIVAAVLEASSAFSPMRSSPSPSSLSPPLHHPSRRTTSTLFVHFPPRSRSDPLRAADDGGAEGYAEISSSSSSSSSLPPSSSSTVSLAEKMKSWEATDDEIRAATLGGVVPGLSAPGLKGLDGKFGNNESAGGRADAFDVGLYIAFPIMVLSCLAVSMMRRDDDAVY